MALLGSLQVRLGLDASTFQTGFNVFQRDLQKRVTGFQRSLRGLTNLGTLIGGAGLTTGLINASNAAVEFDDSMRNVNTLLGLSENEFSGFKTQIAALSADIGETLPTATTALYNSISAGVPKNNILTFLTDAKDAALAGVADLGTSGDALTTSVNAWGLGFENTRDAAATLFVGVKQGKTTLGEIGGSISQIAPLAAELGVTLEEVAAGTASVTTGGGKTAESMTQMRAALVALVKPTKDMEKLLDSTGYESGRAAIEALGFRGTLDLVKTAAGGSDAVLGKALGSVEALNGVLRITGKGGEIYNQTMDLMAQKTDLFNAAIDTKKQGPAYNLARLRETLNGIGRGIVEGGFLNSLSGLADRAVNLITAAGPLPQWLKNTALGITAAGAAAPFLAFGLTSIAGVIPILTKGIGLAATFLLGPWGLALTGAALAAFAFKDQILAEFTAITTGLQNFKENNTAELTALSQEWATFSGLIGTYAQPIIDWITAIDTAGMSQADAMEARTNARAKFWEDYLGGLTIIGTNILAWFNEAIPAIELVLGEWLEKFRTWIDEQLAAGDRLRAGFANFFGGIRDTVTTITASITGALDSITSKITGTITALQSIGQSLGILETKGTSHLSRLSGKINGAAAALQNFGKVGEKETDRAVGNSWLTDLTDQGQRHFQALIQNGISPATAALTAFGKNGDALTPTFTPGIAGGDPTAPFQGLSIDPAQDFESAWSISLRNTQQALDQFVHTGELSVKGLVRTMIAEFASAQLRKALGSIWDSFKGGAGGSGIFSSTSGGGGSIWGSVAGLAGTLFKSFGSFEGGGYTGDSSRTGGLDGRGGRLAILHPKETVIDHTKIKSSAPRQKSVNLTVPITLMPGVSREELAQILPQVQQNIIQIIPELLNRGGAYASAYGR
jgi:TP901 family phage tail tape measure protein